MNVQDSAREFALKFSREVLTQYITKGAVLTPREEEVPVSLVDPGGAFVTLRKAGQLRGCIGRLESSEPRYLTIRDMAIAAATEDPRFSPVVSEELEKIRLEITLLGKPERMKDCYDFVIGEHGVKLQSQTSCAVFLPQVPIEFGWEKKEFLEHLCQKAGLPKTAWKEDPDMEFYRFTGEEIKE